MNVILKRIHILRIFFLFLLSGFVLLTTSHAVYAQPKGVKERLDEVEFSKSRTDKSALYKGLELYKYYWQQFNIKMDASAPAYAQYVTLKRGASSKDFIVLYRKPEMGGNCSRLGCEISVFEDTGNNKWRLVLTAFSDNFFISNIATDGYYNIHLTSSTLGTNEEGDVRKTKFIWTGNKYKSVRDIEKKD